MQWKKTVETALVRSEICKKDTSDLIKFDCSGLLYDKAE